MRVVLLCLIAGCSYSPQIGAAADDDVPSDGAADSPSDTTVMVAACTVQPSSGIDNPATPAFIGGTGGQGKTPAACAPGELPIGLWFNVSNSGIPDHANQVAMVDLHLRCGRIARGTDGVFATTPQEKVDSTGGVGGNCSAYFPNTEIAEVTCPPNRVIVGITGNKLDSTLYNTVVLRCAALDANGAITTDVVNQTVTGTGNHSNQPMAATCAEGMAVTSFQIRSACGHDQLAPRCAPIVCN